ncbi:MAG TPA: tyrosine-type recombinase/integrase, partial [Methanocella sp.]
MINEGFYQHKKKYDFQRTIERNKDFITDDDIFLIQKYVDHKEKSEHITKVRSYKLSTVLVILRKFITMPYREMSLDDVLAGIDTMKNANSIKYDHQGNTLEGPKLKQGTVYDYVTVLKTFLMWLSENEICTCGTVNDLTRTICANRKCKAPLKQTATNGFTSLELKKITAPRKKDATERIDEKDILTPAEIKQIIRSTVSIRDRALLSVLYESGARAGEIGRAVWDDVEFDKHGVSMKIADTKTNKKRYSRLIESTETLVSWRNMHPAPTGQNFIFINPDGSPMTYIGMKRVLERAHARARIPVEVENGETEMMSIIKPVRLHMLRHARATHLIQQNYNIEKV